MKKLRTTASEVELKMLIRSQLDVAEPLLDEIKRQMYLDGAARMYRILDGYEADHIGVERLIELNDEWEKNVLESI